MNSAVSIEESGAKFGPFAKECFFKIENSNTHKSVGAGIKTVEFICLTVKDNILFVEAKTTCPNASNRETSEQKRRKYEEYYTDIADKFVDSVQMFMAAVMGRGGEDEDIGEKLLSHEYRKTGIKLILVITGAEESWLGGAKAELESRLMRLRKIWKADVMVLNLEMAKKSGIIKE